MKSMQATKAEKTGRAGQAWSALPAAKVTQDIKKKSLARQDG